MRNVLHSLGSFWTTFLSYVGFSVFIAATTFAQEPSPSASPTQAQVPNAPITDEAENDRIIVTGSYLPTAETESELPITVYTAEAPAKGGRPDSD